MSRLFVSTFFRMLKKIVFWILLICMFAYGVYSASNATTITTTTTNGGGGDVKTGTVSAGETLYIKDDMSDVLVDSHKPHFKDRL